MATSKLQETVKDRLDLLLTDSGFQENFYPDWLINPETGYKMELDFWLPEAKIAIEVQGRQHYEFIPFFHQTEENFQKQLARDQAKKEQCEKQGVHLYEISDLDDIDRFIEDAGHYCRDIAYTLLRRNTAIKTLSHYAAHLYMETRKKDPDSKRLASLSSKIFRLAARKNIPLKRITPNFELTKASLGYPTKPTIRVKLFNSDGEQRRKAWAAIIYVDADKNIATLRWVYSWRGRHPIEANFDLLTDYQIDNKMDNGYIWKLKPTSLRKAINRPDGQIYKLAYDIFQTRDDIDWEGEKKNKVPTTVLPFDQWTDYRKNLVLSKMKKS